MSHGAHNAALEWLDLSAYKYTCNNFAIEIVFTTASHQPVSETISGLSSSNIAHLMDRVCHMAALRSTSRKTGTSRGARTSLGQELQEGPEFQKDRNF